MLKDRTGKIFLIIIGVTILVIAIAFGKDIADRLNETEGEDPDPLASAVETLAGSNALEITFFSSNTKEDWINTVTESFNKQRFQTSTGNPIEVKVSHGNSGGSRDDILAGHLKPTIWSPGEQSWVNSANQEWRELHGKLLVLEPCSPSVYAPTGFGMWRPMAEALGWPDQPISWDTIISLAADPQGWGSYGHPEWGQFKFGHTHPDYSNTGVLMLTALAYDVTGQTGELTYDMVKSEPVMEAMRNVELHTYHYGKQSRNLANLMALRGPSYLHAITMTEAEVLRTNREQADVLQFPLVFIFPANGTFWAEHPLCILDGDWVNAEQKEAARLYIGYLLAREQQVLAVDYGLHPIMKDIPLHAPLSLENGTDPRVTMETVPALPSQPAEVSEAIIDVFYQVKKKATVIVILDTSGSMKGDKIKGAAEATANFIKRMERGDEIAVYAFNSAIVPLQPSGEVGSAQEELGRTVRNLIAGGDTALYDAICQAIKDIDVMHSEDLNADEKRLYGVVVLSDGQDTSSRLTELEMFTCLPSGEDVEGIKIFTIAYGDGADKNFLERVATRTNGRMFDGDPDSIESVYEAISAEQ